MAATRDEVFQAINTERDYQDARKGNAARETKDTNRELASLVLLMDAYMTKAKAAHALPSPEGRTELLNVVRKVTALGVLAMEEHGAIPRGQ